MNEEYPEWNGKKIRTSKLSVKSCTVEVPFTTDLETDNTYSIAMLVDVIDIQTPTNHDGTHNRKFIAKPTGELAVSDKYKKKVYIKATGTKSQQWRRFVCSMNDGDLDDNDFYEKFMNTMYFYRQDVYALVKKCLNIES